MDGVTFFGDTKRCVFFSFLVYSSCVGELRSVIGYLRSVMFLRNDKMPRLFIVRSCGFLRFLMGENCALLYLGYNDFLRGGQSNWENLRKIERKQV